MHVCLISHNDWSRNKPSGRRERGSVCTVDVYVYEVKMKLKLYRAGHVPSIP